MADASFSLPVRSLTQTQFVDWFWSWMHKELLSVDTYGHAAQHAAFVRANPHLKPEHWSSLRNRQWIPTGIPLFAPFAPTGKDQGGFYVQIRPAGGTSPPKRRLHRLACATIGNRLPLFLADPTLEASHRLITFTGMERDFNANNLVPESGKLLTCSNGK